eukprot:jgi/Mesvir1/4810/Mv11104-RA.1
MASTQGMDDSTQRQRTTLGEIHVNVDVLNNSSVDARAAKALRPGAFNIHGSSGLDTNEPSTCPSESLAQGSDELHQALALLSRGTVPSWAERREALTTLEDALETTPAGALLATLPLMEAAMVGQLADATRSSVVRTMGRALRLLSTRLVDRTGHQAGGGAEDVTNAAASGTGALSHLFDACFVLLLPVTGSNVPSCAEPARSCLSALLEGAAVEDPIPCLLAALEPALGSATKGNGLVVHPAVLQVLSLLHVVLTRYPRPRVRGRKGQVTAVLRALCDAAGHGQRHGIVSTGDGGHGLQGGEPALRGVFAAEAVAREELLALATVCLAVLEEAGGGEEGAEGGDTQGQGSASNAGARRIDAVAESSVAGQYDAGDDDGSGKLGEPSCCGNDGEEGPTLEGSSAEGMPALPQGMAGASLVADAPQECAETAAKGCLQDGTVLDAEAEPPEQSDSPVRPSAEQTEEMDEVFHTPGTPQPGMPQGAPRGQSHLNKRSITRGDMNRAGPVVGHTTIFNTHVHKARAGQATPFNTPAHSKAESALGDALGADAHQLHRALTWMSQSCHFEEGLQASAGDGASDSGQMPAEGSRTAASTELGSHGGEGPITPVARVGEQVQAAALVAARSGVKKAPGSTPLNPLAKPFHFTPRGREVAPPPSPAVTGPGVARCMGHVSATEVARQLALTCGEAKMASPPQPAEVGQGLAPATISHGSDGRSPALEGEHGSVALGDGDSDQRAVAEDTFGDVEMMDVDDAPIMEPAPHVLASAGPPQEQAQQGLLAPSRQQQQQPQWQQATQAFAACNAPSNVPQGGSSNRRDSLPAVGSVASRRQFFEKVACAAPVGDAKAVGTARMQGLPSGLVNVQRVMPVPASSLTNSNKMGHSDPMCNSSSSSSSSVGSANHGHPALVAATQAVNPSPFSAATPVNAASSPCPGNGPEVADVVGDDAHPPAFDAMDVDTPFKAPSVMAAMSPPASRAVAHKGAGACPDITSCDAGHGVDAPSEHAACGVTRALQGQFASQVEKCPSEDAVRQDEEPSSTEPCTADQPASRMPPEDTLATGENIGDTLAANGDPSDTLMADKDIREAVTEAIIREAEQVGIPGVALPLAAAFEVAADGELMEELPTSATDASEPAMAETEGRALVVEACTPRDPGTETVGDAPSQPSVPALRASESALEHEQADAGNALEHADAGTLNIEAVAATETVHASESSSLGELQTTMQLAVVESMMAFEASPLAAVGAVAVDAASAHPALDGLASRCERSSGEAGMDAEVALKVALEELAEEVVVMEGVEEFPEALESVPDPAAVVTHADDCGSGLEVATAPVQAEDDGSGEGQAVAWSESNTESASGSDCALPQVPCEGEAVVAGAMEWSEEQPGCMEPVLEGGSVVSHACLAEDAAQEDAASVAQEKDAAEMTALPVDVGTDATPVPNDEDPIPAASGEDAKPCDNTECGAAHDAAHGALASPDTALVGEVADASATSACQGDAADGTPGASFADVVLDAAVAEAATMDYDDQAAVEVDGEGAPELTDCTDELPVAKDVGNDEADRAVENMVETVGGLVRAEDASPEVVEVVGEEVCGAFPTATAECGQVELEQFTGMGSGDNVVAEDTATVDQAMTTLTVDHAAEGQWMGELCTDGGVAAPEDAAVVEVCPSPSTATEAGPVVAPDADVPQGQREACSTAVAEEGEGTQECAEPVAEGGLAIKEANTDELEAGEAPLVPTESLAAEEDVLPRGNPAVLEDTQTKEDTHTNEEASPSEMAVLSEHAVACGEAVNGVSVGVAQEGEDAVGLHIAGDGTPAAELVEGTSATLLFAEGERAGECAADEDVCSSQEAACGDELAAVSQEELPVLAAPVEAGVVELEEAPESTATAEEGVEAEAAVLAQGAEAVLPIVEVEATMPVEDAETVASAQDAEVQPPCVMPEDVAAAEEGVEGAEGVGAGEGEAEPQVGAAADLVVAGGGDVDTAPHSPCKPAVVLVNHGEVSTSSTSPGATVVVASVVADEEQGEPAAEERARTAQAVEVGARAEAAAAPSCAALPSPAASNAAPASEAMADDRSAVVQDDGALAATVAAGPFLDTRPVVADEIIMTATMVAGATVDDKPKAAIEAVTAVAPSDDAIAAAVAAAVWEVEARTSAVISSQACRMVELEGQARRAAELEKQLAELREAHAAVAGDNADLHESLVQYERTVLRMQDDMSRRAVRESTVTAYMEARAAQAGAEYEQLLRSFEELNGRYGEYKAKYQAAVANEGLWRDKLAASEAGHAAALKAVAEEHRAAMEAAEQRAVAEVVRHKARCAAVSESLDASARQVEALRAELASATESLSASKATETELRLELAAKDRGLLAAMGEQSTTLVKLEHAQSQLAVAMGAAKNVEALLHDKEEEVRRQREQSGELSRGLEDYKKENVRAFTALQDARAEKSQLQAVLSKKEKENLELSQMCEQLLAQLERLKATKG